MTTHSIPPTLWTGNSLTRPSAGLGESAEHVKAERTALSRHLVACSSAHTMGFKVLHAAELTHGFFVSRFVTTLALIAIIISVGSLAI